MKKEFKKHYLEVFFETLSKYYLGIVYKNYKIIVKYYLQESTFSYEIFVFPENLDLSIVSLLGKPNYESEVFYDWYVNSNVILKDIKETIKLFKLEINKRNESN